MSQDRLSGEFLKRHHGAILFRDSFGGHLAWYGFYPLSFATYTLFGIDSWVYEGDSFALIFCNDDYIG